MKKLYAAIFAIAAGNTYAWFNDSPQSVDNTPQEEEITVNRSEDDLKCSFEESKNIVHVFDKKTGEIAVLADKPKHDNNGNIYGFGISTYNTEHLTDYPKLVKVNNNSCIIRYENGSSEYVDRTPF